MRFHIVEEALLDPSFWLPEEGKSERLERWRGCHKFYFGRIERLPGLRWMEFKDFPRLPYPTVACEIEVPCTDGRLLSMIVVLNEFTEHVGSEPYIVTPSKVISLGSHIFHRATGEWMWSPNGKYAGVPVEVRERDAAAAAGVVAAAGLGLMVLGSPSVRQEVIHAPARLNKKRIEKGRVPVYEYKVLVLKKTGERIDGIGGTHDSPILHTVRGHWKTRKTGIFFWNWHLAGSREKGFRRKDYDASVVAGQQEMRP